MTKHKSDAQLYLETYPALQRTWINQCVACQRQGYKPNMPDSIHPGMAAQNLRAYFQPMEVDENGLCKLCARTLD